MIRNDPRLTEGQLGESSVCKGMWGPTNKFTHVVFDCGAELDVETSALEDLMLARVRVEVEPTGEGLNVDLYRVVRPYNGLAPREIIMPLVQWIRAKQVKLEVFDLRHLIPPGYDALVHHVAVAASGRTDEHKYLCGVASAFLTSLGLDNLWADGCQTRYPDFGRADVKAVDGSLYVECGTLEPKKLRHALMTGLRVMIIPYDDVVRGYLLTPLVEGLRDLEEDEGEDMTLREYVPARDGRATGVEPGAKSGLQVKLGEAARRRLTEIHKAQPEPDVKTAPVETIPTGAATAHTANPEPTKINEGGQALTRVDRRRVNPPILFRRNGSPLDLGWAKRQAKALHAKGRSLKSICAAFAQAGVGRGDGSDLNEADVKTWISGT